MLRMMFDRLIHADWSVDPRKRWVATAVRNGRGWLVSTPRPVGPIPQFVDAIFESGTGKTLVGFDFPIGVPAAYGERSGFANFRQALAHFGKGDWTSFYDVARVPGEVGLRRPFYPQTGTKGVRRAALVTGLGVDTFEDLLRKCERRTTERRAACSLFWTLGGNQVGRAALSGWREVVGPALDKGALLWPFDGSLASLSARDGVVIAETYPAEAYRMFNASFRPLESKRRRADRATKANAIFEWAEAHEVELGDAARLAISDGFGEASSGEDAFDSLAGLLKMIDVCDGRRPEATEPIEASLKWEGWILAR